MPEDRASTRRHRRAACLLAAALALFGLPLAHGAAAPAPAPGHGDHDWARGAVVYGVFVRSFAVDLKGLIAKLDYLNDGDRRTASDLGIDALWLRHESAGPEPAAHAADAADADLDRLVSEAHRRGIKVLVEPAPKETEGMAAAWRARGVDGFVPGGDDLPLRLDAPLAEAIVQGVKSGRAAGIAAQLRETERQKPAGAIDAPFLTRLDTTRLATRLGGDLASQKSAAAVLLTLPGAPVITYGDELGLGDGPGGGRAPMPWDGIAGVASVATQATDPSSLLSTYRFLIRARHNSAALRKGDLELLSPPAGETAVLAYLRVHDKERVLAVHNLGAAAIDAGPFAVSGAPDPLFASPGTPPPHVTTGAAASFTVHLPPHGSGVWRLR
ncbi:MAG TPA: alpha-amylase family glycosyl hydrolase [Thermoanaerobaculia bacterium]